MLKNGQVLPLGSTVTPYLLNAEMELYCRRAPFNTHCWMELVARVHGNVRVSSDDTSGILARLLCFILCSCTSLRTSLPVRRCDVKTLNVPSSPMRFRNKKKLALKTKRYRCWKVKLQTFRSCTFILPLNYTTSKILNVHEHTYSPYTRSLTAYIHTYIVHSKGHRTKKCYFYMTSIQSEHHEPLNKKSERHSVCECSKQGESSMWFGFTSICFSGLFFKFMTTLDISW